MAKPREMEKLRVIKGRCIGGGRDVQPGEIVELPAAIAKEWVSRGWGARLDPEERDLAPTHREPAPESRDPGTHHQRRTPRG